MDWKILAAVVGVIAVPLNVFLVFYFKWVPDVERQKAHLKQAGWWAADIGTVVSQVWPLYRVAHDKGPVTPSLVVTAAVYAAGLAFCVTLIIVRRTQGRLLERQIDLFGRHLETTDRQIDAILKHRDALRLLAHDSNLSPEYAARLRKLLGMEEPKTEIKQLSE